MADAENRTDTLFPQQTFSVRKRPAGGYADAAPQRGWDNAIDLSEGERLCRDYVYILAPLASERLIGAVYNLVDRLREIGISRKTAAKLVVEFAKPPLDAADVRAVAHDVYFEAGLPPGLASRAGQFDPTPDDWPAADPVEEPDPFATPEELAAAAPAVWPRPVEYEGSAHGGKLAKAFLAARPEKLIFAADQFYSLERNTVWREYPDDALANEIFLTDPTLSLTPHKIRTMVESLRMACRTDARPFDWIDEPMDGPDPANLIVFRNGLLDTRREELREHDGRLFITGTPDYDYDPDAKCPTWDRCLAEWLHESFHDTLHEFLGYLLTPDTRYEKLLALIGARRGGKSTILRVMRELVGAQHVASRSLNDLGGEFGLEGCLDKRIIAIPDAHDSELSKRSIALDRIKTISGNDSVSINRKNMPIVTAHIPARLVIAANRNPKFIDESGALAAREIILVFERSFEGREDRDLARKLRRELSGIANRALEGLRRLRENEGRFTVGTRGREALRELQASQSPALRFARHALDITGNPDDCAPLDVVFEFYLAWVDEERLGGKERRSRSDFKEDLAAALAARGVRFTRRRWHDPAKPEGRIAPRVRGFFGARLKPKIAARRDI